MGFNFDTCCATQWVWVWLLNKDQHTEEKLKKTSWSSVSYLNAQFAY